MCKFGFKESLFLLFELGDYSTISRVVIVLIKILTPYGFLEDLPTLLVKEICFLLSIGGVAGPGCWCD
jgi:hypothetical protein